MTQYDQIAKKYKDAEEAIIKKYVVEPTFIDLVKTAKNKKVVDLACGSGYFTRKLKEMGTSKVLGIDLSKKEIKLAKALEQKNEIEYFVGDVATFDFSKLDKFDLATAIFLLHYSATKDELMKMCENIYCSLKKGGKFIAILPNGFIEQKNKKYEVTAERMEGLKNGGKRKSVFYLKNKKMCTFFSHYWSQATHEKALKKAGFKNIKWSPVVISKKGMKKFGEDFWQDFLEKPYIIGLTCRK